MSPLTLPPRKAHVLPEPGKHPPRLRVAAPLAIFAAIALLIGGSFVLQRGWEQDPNAAPSAAIAEAWRAERTANTDRLAIGTADAPVELVVFTDYQCPFCAHWDRETLPALLDYVDTGQLRIAWRPANQSGTGSTLAARAVYAAALQDSLLPFHTALAQDGRGAAAEDLTEGALVALATELGLDPVRFTADFTSPEAERAVTEAEAEAQRAGVVNAPSFLFNGEFVAGLKPTETFVAQIEAALAALASGDSALSDPTLTDSPE